MSATEMGLVRRSQTDAAVCAWCQKERGEQPQPGQSHGTCERHRDGMLHQLEVYRRMRLPEVAR